VNTGKNGIELIKRAEGCSLKAYRCPAGVLTIGYGATNIDGIPVSADMTITEREAETILKSDLRRFENAVNRLVKVPLTQNQFDALISFTFNVGEGNLAKSTLLKKLNKGDYQAVPAELAKWNKAGGKVLRGLVARRSAEAALWTEFDMEREDTTARNITRDVPSYINAENIAAAGGISTTVASVASDPASPLTWALAAIAVMTAAVFLYLFIKRRGA